MNAALSKFDELIKEMHICWYPLFTFFYELFHNRLRMNSRFGGSRPTYGRVVHKEPPKIPLREIPSSRARSFNYNKDISKFYGKGEASRNRAWAGAAVTQNLGFPMLERESNPSRRRTQFRFAGRIAPTPNHGMNSLLTPQKGSFQRLKELIWTERARELAHQRKTEEMIARAAVLKEIANGQRYDLWIFFFFFLLDNMFFWCLNDDFSFLLFSDTKRHFKAI